jgi:hypothetical protein
MGELALSTWVAGLVLWSALLIILWAFVQLTPDALKEAKRPRKRGLLQ